MCDKKRNKEKKKKKKRKEKKGGRGGGGEGGGGGGERKREGVVGERIIKRAGEVNASPGAGSGLEQRKEKGGEKKEENEREGRGGRGGGGKRGKGGGREGKEHLLSSAYDVPASKSDRIYWDRTKPPLVILPAN